MQSTFAESSDGRPINALVLDDDDFDRRRITRMGAASGLNLNVVSVPTIDAMRSRLDLDVFDLIFLDYRLSNETGLDALEHIQSHQTNAQAAKVMLTGHLKLEVAVAAFRNGCDDYVNKDDLSPVMLRQTVETVLAKSRQQVLRPDISDDVMDRAVFDLAVTRLPEIMARVLASGEVQRVVGPLLQDAIREGLDQTLARYDLPQSVYADPQVNRLLATMTEQQQIHLND